MTGHRWRSGTRILVGLAVVVALGSGGCGRKTLPQPPPRPELAGIRDFAAKADSGGVVLTWRSPPAAPQQVAAFTVYRAQVSPRSCSACPLEYRAVATIDATAAAPAYTFEDRPPGGIYRYRIVPLDHHSRPGPSSEDIEVTVPRNPSP